MDIIAIHGAIAVLQRYKEKKSNFSSYFVYTSHTLLTSIFSLNRQIEQLHSLSFWSYKWNASR